MPQPHPLLQHGSLFGQHPAKSIQVKRDWAGRRCLQCAVSEGAFNKQSTPPLPKFQSGIRQEEKEGNSILAFQLPFNSSSFIESYIQ